MPTIYAQTDTLPDATSTVKGAVKLAGDLSGTADVPLVAGLTGKIASSTFTAKGSILTATASGTPSELVVGTDGQIVVADTSQSRGVKFVGAPTVLGSVTGINAKNTGTTTLYTVPASRRCFVTSIMYHVTAATAITIVPTISVGQNAATYNDIVVATAATGLNTLNYIYTSVPIGTYVSVPSSTLIAMNVTIGATATTMTVSAYLIGILI